MNTHKQLKKALAKMLPKKITWEEFTSKDGTYYYYLVHKHNLLVLDSELLHLCWLVEKELNDVEANWYSKLVNYHSNWQERITALAKVKGIEI